ncbi:hypothetical protein I302_102734 [Kwoniella bestiolae CBS 10118]|uniref:Uncharacterized protein n=1 Tax=Kwoniella bestiolae CBS 10118 TaxID=1296100 RepID=A0A1B9GFT2_9TREE|nr:hypothetical protein I302_01427 [Kwoniella bestiolae CBS 10118]OCF29914.1 hypothetical protein I302_01427 [Kwoniella bestiolae CBS 10118]
MDTLTLTKPNPESSVHDGQEAAAPSSAASDRESSTQHGSSDDSIGDASHWESSTRHGSSDDSIGDASHRKSSIQQGSSDDSILGVNALAQRLRTATNAAAAGTEDIFLCSQFRAIANNENGAKDLAHTLLTASKVLSEMEDSEKMACNLRDNLTCVFEYAKRVRTALYKPTATLGEDALKAINHGDEWELEQLYRGAIRSRNLKRPSDLKETIGMLHKIDEWRKNREPLEEMTCETRSGAESPKHSWNCIRDAGVPREPSSTHTTSAIDETNAQPLTLENILHNGTSPSRPQLSIDLMNFASTRPGKCRSMNQVEVLHSLATNAHLTDLRASSIEVIDYAMAKEMSQTLRTLSGRVEYLSENITSQPGKSIRRFMDREDTAEATSCLNSVSGRFPSILNLDPDDVERMGNDLVTFATMLRSVRSGADKAGIKYY